jgi:hypothetical protein
LDWPGEVFLKLPSRPPEIKPARAAVVSGFTPRLSWEWPVDERWDGEGEGEGGSSPPGGGLRGPPQAGENLKASIPSSSKAENFPAMAAVCKNSEKKSGKFGFRQKPAPRRPDRHARESLDGERVGGHTGGDGENHDEVSCAKSWNNFRHGGGSWKKEGFS